MYYLIETSREHETVRTVTDAIDPLQLEHGLGSISGLSGRTVPFGDMPACKRQWSILHLSRTLTASGGKKPKKIHMPYEPP